MADDPKIVKSTKKVGGLIQKGLERVGKTLNNFNQIVISTQSGYEREEAILKEKISTKLLLDSIQLERKKVEEYHKNRFEKNEISSEEYIEIKKQVKKIYDAKEKIYIDRIDKLNEEKEKLEESYKELIAKTYREAFQRKLKQRETEKTVKKDEANKIKATEIIGVICNIANVVISMIAIGNKKIESLVDDTITIIENISTKQDIEKAKLYKNNALLVIAANRRRLMIAQQIIDVLNLLAPLITPIVTFFKSNPIPSSVPPGVGVPLGTIATIDDKNRKLQDIIDASSSVVSVLSNIISKLIDDLNYQESRLSQISDILDQNLDNLSTFDINNLLIPSNQLGYLKGYDYKGFKFFLKEEQNPDPKNIVKGNKRRYAVAINKDGNEVLMSELSFTLEPNTLIEQLKIQIDQKNLVA